MATSAPAPSARGDDFLLQMTETWFVRRGLPYFIEDRRATEDVFTRAFPLLIVYFVVDLMIVLSLHLNPAQRVLGAVLGVLLLSAVYVVRNLAFGRPALTWPKRIGWVELAAFIVIPPAVDAVVRKGWNVTGLSSWKITGIDLLVNVGVVLGVYVFTGALLPLFRWALKRIVMEIGEVFDLAARALPLLFLFNSFLFISKDVWEFAGEMTPRRLWTLVALFVVFTVMFLLYQLPAEVRRVAAHDDRTTIVQACVGTPLEGVVERITLHEGELRLSRQQRANVLMVLFVGQILQVLLLAVLVFLFFVCLGQITLTPKLINDWSAQPEDYTHYSVIFNSGLSQFLGGAGLDTRLLQVSVFLGAVSAFFFAVSSMTDDAYKEQFYARMNAELETAIQVRRVYLALYEGRRLQDGPASHMRLRLPVSMSMSMFSRDFEEVQPSAPPTRAQRGLRWFDQGARDGGGGGGLGQAQETVENPAAELES
jgi:hypothetical protein